jgi:hypothetical protein
VASDGTLTLENLTLQNGLAFGSGAAAEGGAIYNQGSLVLNAVTVQANTAQGSDGKSTNRDYGGAAAAGQDAAGGGIWSNDTLTLANGTLVQKNKAIGGNGGRAVVMGGNGGNGSGGGVYVAGGTANLTSATLASNATDPGFGGPSEGPSIDGSAFGGGLYVAGGTVRLCNDTITSNRAGDPLFTYGVGGGLYLAAGATVDLDSFTLAHTSNNLAYDSPDISGSYTLQNCP